MMGIPARIDHDKDKDDSIMIGELLAIASLVMCLKLILALHGQRKW
jgi:hypothetical protein